MVASCIICSALALSLLCCRTCIIPPQGRWDHRRTAYQVGPCQLMQSCVASLRDAAALAMQASSHAITGATPTTMLLLS